MARRANGEGSIYKDHTHGLWYGVVTIGGVSSKTKGCKTQAQAREAKAELERQLTGGISAKGFKNVGAYLDYWLEEAVKPARKAQTYRNYAKAIKNYIKPEVGNVAMLDLGPQHIQAAQNRLLARSLAPATINNHFRAVLKRALNQALRWGFVARNVVNLVDPPRAPKVPVVPLSIANARRFLAACEGHRLYCLYRLALALGIRRGELLALRWRDFDATAATLTIRATMDGKRAIQEETKGGAVRVLELSSDLVSELQRHWAAQQIERTESYWQEHGYIFPSEVGTPLNPRNLYRHFKDTITAINRGREVRVSKGYVYYERARDAYRGAAHVNGVRRLTDRCKTHKAAVAALAALKAEIDTTASGDLFPDTRFHDLRHSCAAYMLSSGYGLEHVRQILGHSSIKVTSDTYGHLLPGVLREATSKVDQLLTG